jgi:tetratricopeptide (TPR) repeat protein
MVFSPINKNNSHLKELILITSKFVYSFFFIVFWGCITTGCKHASNTTESSTSGDPEIDKISSEILKTPDSALLYFDRAQKYYDKSAYGNAILDLQKAISLDSLNPEFYHLLSDTYLDYANSNGAISTMNKVLAIYPERIPSLLKLAELKHIIQDYDGSVMTLNEVVRLDPQNGEAYFMLGMNFRSLNDKDRAINAFQTAVEMDSGLTDAWIILGEMYEDKKDPRAIKYFESAILSNPASMQAKHAKAYYLQNHGDIPGAQKIYRDIIMTDKLYADAYLNSGLLYLETDSLDRAYEQFDLMTAMLPTNYMGYFMRGIVNEKKGKKQAALSDYESAQNLNKDDEKVKKAIETLKNHF